ncbi:MAG: hypothetical protein RIR11_1349 [Bacteroidota bacterium]|jgi:hypothetical protein
MKSYVLTNLLFLLCWSSLLGQKNEEAAIQQLLENETEAFTKMSLADVVKTYWIMDDKTLLNVTMPDGNHIQEKLSDLLEDTQVPPEGHAKVQKMDFKFSIFEQVALVSFKQTVTTEEGDKVNSHEIRFLEKVNGVWKIHVSSVHQYMPKGDE